LKPATSGTNKCPKPGSDWDVGADYLRMLGREVILMKCEFNTRAGFTKKDDRILEWMRYKKLPPHNSVCDAPDSELDTKFSTPVMSP
jgi:aldehyde:ferredoxin oxidoreductase